jgi:hypothetical protein
MRERDALVTSGALFPISLKTAASNSFAPST